MKIYNYDALNFEFISENDAILSPLEKDIFLIPKNATAIAPLLPKKGFAVCFDEKSQIWEYKKDERGKIYYNKNGNEVEITQINEDTSKYSSVKPEPKELSELEQLNIHKAELKDEIITAMIADNSQSLAELKDEYKQVCQNIMELEKEINDEI